MFLSCKKVYTRFYACREWGLKSECANEHITVIEPYTKRVTVLGGSFVLQCTDVIESTRINPLIYAGENARIYSFFHVRKTPVIAAIRITGAALTNSHSNE